MMADEESPAGARRSWSALALTSFAALGYLFLVAPIVVVIVMSFGNQFELRFPPRAYSLYLYEKFLTDPSWMRALAMSIKVACLSTILALVIGVPAARGLARGTYVGKQIITVFLLSPVFVPVVVIAFALYLYFSWLALVGTLPGLVFAHTVYILPFVLITCLAGMRHVDRNLEVTAAIMGAGHLTIFLRVTLPLLFPAIVVGALFAFLMSFDEVVISLFVVQTSTITLPVKMYAAVQQDTSPVLAAVASLLTLLSIAICLVGGWLRRRRQ
jgi:putative spermidine/putrescine transport system permease protein